MDESNVLSDSSGATTHNRLFIMENSWLDVDSTALLDSKFVTNKLATSLKGSEIQQLIVQERLERDQYNGDDHYFYYDIDDSEFLWKNLSESVAYFRSNLVSSSGQTFGQQNAQKRGIILSKVIKALKDEQQRQQHLESDKKIIGAKSLLSVQLRLITRAVKTFRVEDLKETLTELQSFLEDPAVAEELRSASQDSFDAIQQWIISLLNTPSIDLPMKKAALETLFLLAGSRGSVRGLLAALRVSQSSAELQAINIDRHVELLNNVNKRSALSLFPDELNSRFPVMFNQPTQAAYGDVRDAEFQSSHCVTSDGTFIYIYDKAVGLMKVGTGFNGTKQGEVYLTQPVEQTSTVDGLAVINGSLYAFIDDELHRFDIGTLQTLEAGELPEEDEPSEDSPEPGYITSDGTRLFVVCRDFFTIKVYRIENNTPVYERSVKLNSQQTTSVFGASITTVDISAQYYTNGHFMGAVATILEENTSQHYSMIYDLTDGQVVSSKKLTKVLGTPCSYDRNTNLVWNYGALTGSVGYFVNEELPVNSEDIARVTSVKDLLPYLASLARSQRPTVNQRVGAHSPARPFFVEPTMLVVDEVKALLTTNKDPKSTEYLLEILATTLFYVSRQNRLTPGSEQDLKATLVKLLSEKQESLAQLAMESLVVGWSSFMNQKDKTQFIVGLSGSTAALFYRLFYAHHRSHADLATLLGLSMESTDGTTAVVTAMLKSVESLGLLSAVLNSLALDPPNDQLFAVVARQLITVATTTLSSSFHDLEKQILLRALLSTVVDLLRLRAAENSEAILHLLQPLIQLAKKVDATNVKLFNGPAEDIEELYRKSQVQLPSQEVKESQHPCEPDTDTVDIFGFPKADYMIVEFDAKTALGPGMYLHIMNPERTVRVCPPLTDKSTFPVRLLVPGDALALVFHTPEEMSSDAWGYKCYITGVAVPHKEDNEGDDEEDAEKEEEAPELPWTVDLETRLASLIGDLLKTMTGMSALHQDTKMDPKLFDAGIDENQKNDELIDDLLDIANATKPVAKLAKWLESRLLGGPSHQGSVTVAERYAIAAVLHFRPNLLDEVKKLTQSATPPTAVPPAVSSVWSIARAIRQQIMMRVQAASASDDFSKGLDAKGLLAKKTNLYQEIASSIIARAKLLLNCVVAASDVSVEHVQAFLVSNLDAQVLHASIKQGQLAVKQREEAFIHVLDLVKSLDYPHIINEVLATVGKAFSARKNVVTGYSDQLQGASADSKQKLSKAFADLYLGLLDKLVGTPQHHLTYDAAASLLTAAWLPSDASVLHKNGIMKKASTLYSGNHSDLGLLVFWSVGHSVFKNALETDQGVVCLLTDFVEALQPVLTSAKTASVWVRRFVALFFTLLSKSSVSNLLRSNKTLAKVFVDSLARSTESSTTSLLLRSLRFMSSLGPAVLASALEVSPSRIPVPTNAHHLLKSLKQNADSATPFSLVNHGPTKMNGSHTCGAVLVSDDGYVLVNSHMRTDTVSLVHSDRAVPASAKFFYYEVTIVNPGKDAAVSIGLYPTAQIPQMDGMPGWSHGSYGYHADDGNAFNYRLEGSGAEFGPTWEKPSDVAGLFWDCETGSIAFTRNGATVGLAFRNVFGSFFPAVGINSPSAVVAINFGQRPFTFDTKNKFGELLALTRPLKHQRDVIEAHDYECVMLSRHLFSQGAEWETYLRNMVVESLKSIPEFVKAVKTNVNSVTPNWNPKLDKACKSLEIIGAFKDHPRIGAKVALGSQSGVIVATNNNGKYEVMLRDAHAEESEHVLDRFDFIVIENEHDIQFSQDSEVKPEMVPLTKELCEVFQAIIPFNIDVKSVPQTVATLFSRVKMMSIQALDALVKFPQNNLDPVLQETIMPSLVQLALSPLSTTDRVKLLETEKKLANARRYLSFLPEQDLTASAEKKVVAAKAQKVEEEKDDDSLSFNDKLLKIMKAGSLSFADVREIKEEFSVFDLDGDGRISLAEFILALTALGRGGDDADIETFQQMDVNNDGEVEFLEFLSFIANKKQIEEGAISGATDVHVNWRCDGCGASPIKGSRYKNANLPDFDLCEKCYTTKDRLSWQIYYKVNVPLPSRRECPSSLFPVIYPPPSAVLPLLPNLYKNDKLEKPAANLVHKDIKCDMCNKTPIVGVRFKALSKPNFNICATCEKEEAKNNPKNIYLVIETPVPADAFSAKGSALLPDLYGSEASKGNIAIENIQIGWRLSVARPDVATQGFWVADMNSTVGKVGIVENINVKDKYVLLRLTNIDDHSHDDEDDHDEDEEEEDEQLFWYHINSLELVDTEFQRATKTEIQQQRAVLEQQLAVLYSRQATFSFLKNVPATETLSLHVIGGAISLIQLLKLMILENISATSVESVDFSLKENNELKLVKERVRQILKQETVFRSLPHGVGAKSRVDQLVRKIATHWLNLAKPRIEERKKLAGVAPGPNPTGPAIPKQGSLPKMPIQGKGPGFVKGTVGPKQPLQGPLAKSNPKLPMPPTGTAPPKIGTAKFGPKVGTAGPAGGPPSPVKTAVGPVKQPASGVAKLTAAFQPARVPAKVLFSGSLQMLSAGPSIGRQQWMERFVVLTENSLNVKKAKPLPPISETELKNIIAVKVAPKTLNRDNCFEVTIPNNTLIFSCENPQDQQTWIKTINDSSAPLRKEETNQVRVRRKESIAAIRSQPTPGNPKPATPKLQPVAEKPQTQAPTQPQSQPAAESGFQSKFTDMLISECIRNLIGSLDQEYPYLVEESSHPYQNNAKFRRMIKLEGSESCCVIFDKDCHTEAGFDFCSFFEDASLNKLIGIFHGKGHQAWPTTIVNSNTFWLTFETDKENPEWGYKFWVVPLAPKLTDEEMLTKPSFEFGMFVVDWLLNMEPVWVKPLYCNELFEALIKHYHKREFAVPNRIRILTAIVRLFNQWRLFDEDDRPNVGLLAMLETEVKQLYEDERKSIASTHSLYLQRMIEVLIKVNHAKQLDFEEKGQVLPDAQKLGFKKSYGFFKNGQELADVMDKLLKGQNFSKEFIKKAFTGKFRQHQGQVWVEESTHPYRPQSNLDSSINIKNATDLLIEFDPRTSLVPNHAFLVFEDEQGELIERFSQTFPAQLKIKGNSFVWRFMSNRNFPDWGFRFTVTPLFDQQTAAEQQSKSEKMMKVCLDTLDEWTVHKDQQLVSIINAIAKFKRLHTQDSTPYGIHESVQFSLSDCDTAQLAPLLQNFTMEAIEARFELLKYFNYRVGKLLPFLDLRKIVDQWSLAASLSHLRGLLFWGMKTEWLTAALHETSTNLIRPKMKLNRHAGALWRQVFKQFQKIQSQRLRQEDRAFEVIFEKEGATDIGGPYRETISQVCKEIQSEKELFVQTANNQFQLGPDQEKFVPNPSASTVASIRYFEFIGKLIGIAIRTRNPLEFDWPSIIWKPLVGLKVDVEDLKNIDMNIAHLLENIRGALAGEGALTRETFEDVIFQNFTAKSADGRDVELRSGGEEENVTFDNRLDFAKLLQDYKLHEFVPQVEAMIRGINQILPQQFLNILTPREVEQRVCGSRSVDINVLKSHTVYKMVDPTAPYVKFFWQAVEGFTEEQKQLLIRFVLGRSRLPADNEWPMPFALCRFLKDGNPDQFLPEAHTCFFSLDLPQYSSLEVTRDRLLYAITTCVEIDTDFVVDDEPNPFLQMLPFELQQMLM